MKPQRWYEIEGNTLTVYNAPRPAQATACSMTRRQDLGFYHRNFTLRKVWR